MMAVLGAILAILGLIAALVRWHFAVDLRAHRRRIARGSQLLQAARYGTIEYATVGEGAPVLLAHGAGGGFDQALALSDQFISAGFQLIAPSRFGYLRSSLPGDASPEAQADAYAALLDHLQLRDVEVIGVSAGALSALQFAVRYPARCRTLTLIVPAGAAAGTAAAGVQAPMPEQSRLSRAIVGPLLASDFLYWLGLILAPNRMIRSVLATDPHLVARASRSERSRALDVLWNVLPVSARSRGLLNDTRLVSQPQRIALESVHVPILLVSLEDDFYRTIEAARFLAAGIPGARLLTYPSGGHVWIGHQAELFAEVTAFIRSASQAATTSAAASRLVARTTSRSFQSA